MFLGFKVLKFAKRITYFCIFFPQKTQKGMSALTENMKFI